LAAVLYTSPMTFRFNCQYIHNTESVSADVHCFLDNNSIFTNAYGIADNDLRLYLERNDDKVNIYFKLENCTDCKCKINVLSLNLVKYFNDIVSVDDVKLYQIPITHGPL
jgi:hypothetical protein